MAALLDSVPPYALITCDVEITSAEGLYQLRSIREVLDAQEVPCTFFTEFVQSNLGLLRKEGIVKAIEESGRHQVGVHIHWRDSREAGLRGRDCASFLAELDEAVELAGAAGVKGARAFRAGGLCCSTAMLQALVSRSFTVDSSVAPGLNEPLGWHQGHTNVCDKPWYFPHRDAYWRAADNPAERVGLLEVPVTRLRPAWPLWKFATLQPDTPLKNIIVRQAFRRTLPDRLVNVILHSWGSGSLRGSRFAIFLRELTDLIAELRRHEAQFMTMEEVHGRVTCGESA